MNNTISSAFEFQSNTGYTSITRAIYIWVLKQSAIDRAIWCSYFDVKIFALIVSINLVMCLIGLVSVKVFFYTCWSIGRRVLTICYYSLTPCTCKGDVNARVICHFRFIWIICSIGRPKWAFSCCFGGLSYTSFFCFTTSWVKSMNWMHSMAVTSQGLAFLSSPDLFSRLEKTARLERL